MPIIGTTPVSPVDGVTYPPGWLFGHSIVDVGQCDALGVEWHVGSVDGWDDTPDTVGQSSQRVGGHGLLLGPQTYAGRTLTLTGWIVARNFADRSAALQRLHLSVPVGALVVVAVTDPDGLPTRYVRARIDGQLKAARLGENAYAIQIPLMAPDPRKYGLNPDSATVNLPSYAGGISLPTSLPVPLPVRTSGGSAVVENIGDMAAPWRARIVGPVPSPTITAVEISRHLTVGIDLAEGEYLDFDSWNQTVLLNGSGSASRSGLIARGSTWFELPARATTEIAFSSTGVPSGTPVLTFTPLSAWS
jgi:hypothetical protein